MALAASCMLSGFWPPDSLGPTAVIVLFMWNVFASLEDVAVDSVAVTLLSKQELGLALCSTLINLWIFMHLIFCVNSLIFHYDTRQTSNTYVMIMPLEFGRLLL